MAELMGDYSSMFSNTPYMSSEGVVGSSWIGELAGLGDFANQMEWKRGEQSANNAFVRDMMKLQYQNAFNANQAQLGRDFEERLSNTAYQRAVADMKAAGINPVLAFQQGGAATPSASYASSAQGGSSQSGYASRDHSGKQVVSLIANVIAGAVSKGLSTGLKTHIKPFGK